MPNFSNLKHIILKSNLAHYNLYDIRNFLLKYPNATIQVEQGGDFFLDDQNILHHKSMDIPLLQNLNEIQKLSISNNVNRFLAEASSEMKNLKTLTIENGCDVSSDVLSELLKNNKQITQININNNSNFSYKGNVLYYHNYDNTELPIWKKPE